MANEAEKRAEEKERTVVLFTNVDDERFTHAFRGVTIKVEAGESYPSRLPEAELLAKHLARKILSNAFKKARPGEDGRRLDSAKYTEEQVQELSQRIIKPLAKETPGTQTPEEMRKQDQERLRQEYTPQPAQEVSKKDVIADLKSRGVKVDVTKTKDELLEQLMEAERQGIRPQTV